MSCTNVVRFTVRLALIEHPLYLFGSHFRLPVIRHLKQLSKKCILEEFLHAKTQKL